VPGEDADAWIVSQTNGQPWNGNLGGYDVTLPNGGEGVLIVGHNGALRAAGCEGTVSKGGRNLLSGTARFFAVAQNGGSLADAKELLVLPVGAGEIKIARVGAASVTAEVGELQSGAWHRFAPLPVSDTGTTLILDIPSDHARDMIKITRRTLWQRLFNR